STRPEVGRRVPLSKRSNVVLPEPFGPRMPASAPSARRTVTPSTTSGAPGAYRNETLSAHSKSRTHVGRPARGRIAKHGFVVAVEEVQHAREYFDRAHRLPRAAEVHDGVTGIHEQPAGGSECRLGVEGLAANLDLRKRRGIAMRPGRVERSRMPRPPQQRIADLIRR